MGATPSSSHWAGHVFAQDYVYGLILVPSRTRSGRYGMFYKSISGLNLGNFSTNALAFRRMKLLSLCELAALLFARQ